MGYFLFPKCVEMLTVLCFFICCFYIVGAGVGFEGACSSDDDCSLNGSVCWNGTCLCNTLANFTYDPGSDTCTLGCCVYGSTYQAFGGFRIFFADECLLDIVEDISLEECFNFCNIRKRCLQIRHVYADALCFLSQCSPGLFPELWEFSSDENRTTHVRNCAGNNVVAECPGGQEYSLTSSGCVDCPLNTYKPSTLLNGLCVLCKLRYKANETAALDADQCYVPFFYCDTVSECPVPNMECVNNTCTCISEYYFNHEHMQCRLHACTETGFRRIPSFMFSCFLNFDIVNFETCRDACLNSSICTGFVYAVFGGCFLLDCSDYTASGTFQPLADTFVKVCQSHDVVCYPNGTMVYSNPNTELFIDAMAIQNEGTSAATKCSVSVAGPFIIIDGCDTDLEVNVFLSNRSISDFGDTFGGRASISYQIRCDQISLAGVLRPINDVLNATLEVTTQNPVTPAFIVTSALRTGSASGSTTSTGVVGGTLYWTIDIPAEYNGRPTCTAYSGTSNSGSPNIQVVLDGCTQDSSLIVDDFDNEISPDALTKRLWTQLYIFKFYNSDDIYLACTVKVCPYSSSSCDISCGGKKRGLREIRSGNDMYFTTGAHLHIPSLLSGGGVLSSPAGRSLQLVVGLAFVHIVVKR